MLTEEELEKCENPYEEIAKMAEKIVDEIKEQGYEKGMEDAWEAFKKIALMEFLDLEKIFGKANCDYIFKNFSGKEVKEKVDKYLSEKKEFHVGDEIEGDKSHRYVITRIENDKQFITCIDIHGSLRGVDRDMLCACYKKTGRHFNEIEDLLKKLK